MTRIAMLLGAFSLAGCTSLPENIALREPNSAWTEATVTDATLAKATLAKATLAESAVDDSWWRAFNDPILNAVIARVEDGDDIALAAARLEEAVAGLKRARAALAPELNVDSGARLAKNGDDIPRQDSASGALSAAWTPDLFGQTRLRARAASERARSSASDLAAIRLDTRSAAARLYFAVRSAQGQAKAAEANAASLRETFDLVTARAEAGLAPQFDAAQARAAVAAAQARPPAFRQAETSARLALEALIGAPTGTLKSFLGDAAPPLAPAADAELAPASVLARRPDLQSAEHRLAAAGFDSRAARRDFWPRVTLSALIGGQSLTPETFAAGSGALYNAAAAVAAPAFSFGRLEAARDGADARLQQAMIAYRRQATYALADVERALAARKDAAARQQSLAEALAAARDQAALARERYVAGLSPLLDVLTAERAAFEASAALVVAEADAASAFADMSGAMGLGGAPTEPPPA